MTARGRAPRTLVDHGRLALARLEAGAGLASRAPEARARRALGVLLVRVLLVRLAQAQGLLPAALLARGASLDRARLFEDFHALREGTSLPSLAGALFDPAWDRALARLALAPATLDAAFDALEAAGPFEALEPEALGALHEALAADGSEGARVARRASGAHYTPRALVASLVDAALEPLLAQAARAPAPADALLALTVCDPAAGAGAFLLGCCRALGDALAAAWARDDRAPVRPGEDPTRAARRLLVARALHGADRDPLALDLARLALWVLSASKGDAPDPAPATLHVGDALLGLTLAQLAGDGADFGPRDPALDARLARTLALAADDASRADLAAARALADAALAATLAARTPSARARALATLRARAGDARPRVRAAPPAALHWELRFPRVFAAPSRGFDLVVANPPFGNAIEAATARPPELARFARAAHPEFARGAYDYSLLFWSRALRDLLAPRGRYALLGPAAQLAREGPWVAWLRAHAPPERVVRYGPEVFPAARVRTAAIVGTRGAQPASVTVCDTERVPPLETRRAWPLAVRTLHELFADGPDPAGLDAWCVPLGELAEVFAGCTTQLAYALRPLVTDDPRGAGARLLTTGALDRYACRWGAGRVRFLGADHAHPRWPEAHLAPAGLARALARQRRPKILVGGLTAVIEAYCDDAGDAAGVVSTWVITPRGEDSSVALYQLLGALNSATFSEAYMRRHGARAMSGLQTTIQKPALLAMPVPRDVLVPADPRRALPRVLDPADREALLAVLGAASRALSTLGAASPHRPALDALAHGAAALLFDADPVAARARHAWYCARTRTPAPAESADALLADAAIRTYLDRAREG